LFKRSLEVFEKTLDPNHLEIATALSNLATLYANQGRYTEAEPPSKRSLEIYEKALGPDHPEVATALGNVATRYLYQGRYAEAERLFQRSLEIYEKALGPNHPNVATTLGNLATLYANQARYADAEPLYKRALAIREKALGPDNPDIAAALSNLGSFYITRGRYVDAELLSRRSLAIWEKALGPDHPNVATALSNLATLYRAQGRYTEAEQLYKRSLAIRETALGPNHPDVAISLNNMGELYGTQGRYPEAVPLYKRALQIVEVALGPGHPYVAGSLGNLATLYLTQGRYAEAEPLYERSLAIFEKALGSDHPEVATVLSNLGTLYYREARYVDARPLYERALAIREKALGPYHPYVAGSLNSLVELYQAQGHYSDALPLVDRIISGGFAHKSVALPVLINSQAKSLIPNDRAFDDSLNVIQRASQTSTAAALNKLNVRFSAGNGRLAQLVRKDQDLATEAEGLDRALVEAVSKEPSKRDSIAEQRIRERLDEASKERNDLQQVFVRDFPNYAALSKPEPLTAKEIQSLLDNDEALVVIDLDQFSFVWVVTKDRVEWKAILIPAEQASNTIQTLRAALNPYPDTPKAFDRALAYQLYQQVLGPIEDIISQKMRLSFVLGGALTSLPPQVLLMSDPEGKDPASLDWLVRKYAITILPSVASLKVLRGGNAVSVAAKPMIGFGDPIFGRATQTNAKRQAAALNRSLTTFYRGGTADAQALAKDLAPLPETADELRAIAETLKASAEDIKLGDAASVTAVKRGPLDNYRVVYFATHALVAGEVEQFAKVKAEPSLVLSIPEKPSEDDDGLLRASEVATLKLNADFVVLSACNTAAGDKPGAEALSGLARAFFYAGAKSLIVSHWTVDSDSAVDLMTGLFDALKVNPHLSHAEALRASMLRMITKGPYWAQPKLWAPFIVVGEPRKE
jgi:CHAT domain-containing protein/Tfp pilus assembly protein PilF